MITGQTRVLAVIGDPVSHSRSPELHNAWIRDAGLDAAYVALNAQGTKPIDSLKALAALGFHGANVTLPHKEAALAAADTVSPVARRIGAANTLIVQPDRTLQADNTDAAGFINALREARPEWTADSARVVLLGAGGAARAIAAGLAEAGVAELRIVNRTKAKAEALAHFMEGKSGSTWTWDESNTALDGATLVINATSRGLKGIDPLEIDFSSTDPTAIVVDAVYAPLETAFLKSAAAQGRATVDGLGMLIHQAALSFRHWFGVTPDTTKARARLLGETV
jgi:shikimate dehydrogenase